MLGSEKGLASLAQFAGDSSINALCEALRAFRTISRKGDTKPAEETYQHLHSLIVDVTQKPWVPLRNADLAAAREEVTKGASANPGLAKRLQQVFPNESPPRTPADAKYDMQCWLQGCLC